MKLRSDRPGPGLPPGDSHDPLALTRRAISALMIGLTVGSVALAVSGVMPRAWILAAAIWGIYGAIRGLLGGLEPAIDFLGQLVSNVGLGSAPSFRSRPVARRTTKTAPPPDDPEAAIRELTRLRQVKAGQLDQATDIMIGTTLAGLYGNRLGNPDQAIKELRRLVACYPTAPQLGRILESLAGFEQERRPA